MAAPTDEPGGGVTQVYDAPPGAAARTGGSVRAVRTSAPWGDVLGSWAVARVVVLGALLVAELVRRLLLEQYGLRLPVEGLLGWDADWYRRIAQDGYAGTGRDGLRFFPLVPLAARALAVPLGGSVPAALLVLSNAGALGYALLVHRLALREGLGDAAARRAVWVVALLPAAFVLVMGYSEALAGCLLVGCLLTARDRRWLPAAVLGALAAAARPTGVLVAAAVLVEASRGLPRAGRRELLARALAVAGPAAGLASYLLWVGVRYGDPLLPFRLQSARRLRGGVVVDPFPAVFAGLGRAVTDGVPYAMALHLPGVLAAFALLVVVARRLPASYTVLTALTLAAGVTTAGLSSFERYAGGAVPLVLALALVLRTPARARAALACGSAALAGYALLGFLRFLTP